MLNEIDLMNIEVALEDVEGFLQCFVEYCEDEGLRKCDDLLDQKLAAVCFVERLPMHLPLVRHAYDVISEQRRLINAAQ